VWCRWKYKWLCYFDKIWFSCLTWYSTPFFILSTINWVNKTSKKEIIKTICDSVNHTRFPKEDYLPDWARRDNKLKGWTGRILIIIIVQLTLSTPWYYLMEVRDQFHTPANLSPEKKTRYRLNRRLGWTQSQYGWFWKTEKVLSFEPRTVQPVASR